MQTQNKIVLPPLPDPGSPDCLVYSEHQTPRLEYTCKFIFNTVLASHFRLTLSSDEFENHKGLKINYSMRPLKGGLQFTPHGLLFEKGINNKKPDLHSGKQFHKAFVYETSSDPSLDYDIFSMVFYFVSRYEEWQEFEKDEHQRFGAEQSLLYQYNTLTRPLIDLCVLDLKKELTGFFPNTVWPQHKPELISTIDVDNLYAFKGRPLWKAFAGALRDFLKADLANLSTRIKVLGAKQKDPFDVYDELPLFCEKQSIPLFFFFLYRNGTKYDRGLKPGNPAFLEVFARLKKHNVALGLHPSYYSNKESQLKNELQQFQQDLAEKVSSSRQHYLRFDIRKTPKNLIQGGITNDFSMGFSDTPGFRAGTSFPFYYYDFENEKQEQLLFVPFCIMDGVYSIHHKKTREEIMKEVLGMASEVKKCSGNFVSVFHERSFYNHLYPGFGTLYREMHLQIKALFKD